MSYASNANDDWDRDEFDDMTDHEIMLRLLVELGEDLERRRMAEGEDSFDLWRLLSRTRERLERGKGEQTIQEWCQEQEQMILSETAKQMRDLFKPLREKGKG